MKLPETLSLINPAVRALKSYHLEQPEVPVKLNQNENPFDWPFYIKEEAARFCVERPWNRYPPFVPGELKAMLGEYAGVSAENVIVGNGSNEMLLVIMIALSGPGSTIIICQPTFTVYRLIAEGMGYGCQTVFLDNNLRFDIGGILDAVEKNPGALLLICSPNNPTGTALDERSVRLILGKHRGFFVLDQAYVEFGGFNAVPLIKEFPNLIITRTFSKAFAAAGLRIGYMIGAPEVTREINKIKLPYNINFFTEYAARTALKHRSELSKSLKVIVNERDALTGFLSSLPVTVYLSEANFILIRTRRKKELFDALLSDGILVRDVSGYPMLENCLRISVGSPQENKALRNSMERFFT